MEIVKQVARLFGWKNAQFESLWERNVGEVKIRVWRASSSLEQAGDPKDRADIDAVIDNFEHAPTSKIMQRTLMALPRVACVAIVDANGNGVSAYPDWH
jgi:hypothetical protein